MKDISEEKKPIDYNERERVSFADQPIKWFIYKLFPRLSARDYYAKRWMWIISVALDFAFMAMIVMAMVFAGNMCYMSGLQELESSCGKCLASCVDNPQFSGMNKMVDFNGSKVNASGNLSAFAINITIKEVK